MCYKTRKMNTPTRGWLHDGHSVKKETTTDAHIISEKQEQNKN